jgi:hypothetical protein
MGDSTAFRCTAGQTDPTADGRALDASDGILKVRGSDPFVAEDISSVHLASIGRSRGRRPRRHKPGVPPEWRLRLAWGRHAP